MYKSLDKDSKASVNKQFLWASCSISSTHWTYLVLTYWKQSKISNETHHMSSLLVRIKSLCEYTLNKHVSRFLCAVWRKISPHLTYLFCIMITQVMKQCLCASCRIIFSFYILETAQNRYWNKNNIIFTGLYKKTVKLSWTYGNKTCLQVSMCILANDSTYLQYFSHVGNNPEQILKQKKYHLYWSVYKDSKASVNLHKLNMSPGFCEQFVATHLHI